MELVLFYVIFGVLMTVLKFLEINLDRRAERVREFYSAPAAPAVRQRMVSGDQAE